MPAATIDQLNSAEKRALLARLLRKKRLPERCAPLSLNQERIWFFHQLDPSNVFNTMAPVLVLKGELNVALLASCYNRLIARHSSLRTRFSGPAEEPVQEIMPVASLTLPVFDLTTLDEQEAMAYIDAFYGRERARSFQLDQAPLLRVTLFRLDTDHHVLLTMMHHIISDGGSQAIFVRELGELYAAGIWNMDVALPDLPLQYADFADWQRRFAESQRMRDQIDFWRERLANVPASLDLPGPLYTADKSGAGLVAHVLPRELSEQLNDFCREHKLTPFTVLLATFKLLLYRYTGQADQVVGTVVAGRTRPELEGLVGLFMNTLALRTRLQGHWHFVQLLRALQQSTLEAFSHQDVPFSHLVDALCPKRGTDLNPLFSTAFSLQADVSRIGSGFPGLSWTYYYPPMELHVTEDLDLEVTPKNGRLHLRLLFRRETIDAGLAERLVIHYEHLLSAVCEELDETLDHLPYLAEAERVRLLQTFSGVEVSLSPQGHLKPLIEARAAQHPQRPAIYDPRPGTWLDYGTLDRRANRVAHTLRRKGIGPEKVVGLHTARSHAGLIALLGIIKTGAAFLPLDPQLPEDRLAYMMETAHMALLISDADQPPQIGVPLLRLADESVWLADESLPFWPVDDAFLAYIIFTSGSTGRPKGVQISHYNWFTETEAFPPDYRPGSRHLQMASMSFDVFACDFARALCHGGSLVLVPREVLLDPEQLLALIEHTQPDFADFVPAVLRALCDILIPRGKRLPLNVVTAGADIWTIKDRNLFLQILPGDGAFYNAYGVTETSCENTTYTISSKRMDEGRTVPIGGPIGHTHTFLLDRNLEFCPVGVAGELYLGGPCVGRGYLQQPLRTASVFVPNPFSPNPGERLYRTGDRMMYLPDGSLYFLGRIDHQVKIRGFRVEVGEIETLLTDHEAIMAAAVHVHRVGGEATACAYLVGDASVPLAELKHFLASRLPDYMVPGFFMFLPELPLNPNGKIDRKALPVPESDLLEDDFVAPRTALEVSLCDIFAEVLEAERVSVRGNFFELGGHSLMATRAIHRINSRLGLALNVRDLFQNPRPAQLAELIGEAEAVADIAVIPHRLDSGPAPLSSQQLRLWFVDRFQPGSAAYNIPMALSLKGLLDRPALERALTAVISRHDALRTTFAVLEEEPRQFIDEPAPFRFVDTNPLDWRGTNFPAIDLRHLEPDPRMREAREILAAEAARPFDLSTGPLFRVCLLHMGEAHWFLAFNMHHIITDGWSYSVLVGDLAEAYTAAVSGEPPELQPLPIQYTDYAAYQKDYFASEKLAAQRAWWVETLGRNPAVLDLPTTYARPPISAGKGALLRFRLDADLVSRLENLARDSETTLFVVLAGALYTLLYRYTDQRELLLGTPVANRNPPELEALVGFFVNTLVLRHQLEPVHRTDELLPVLHDAIMAAFDHGEVPFEWLVDDLLDDRDSGHTPLAQVMMVLQNTPDTQLTLPGLELEPLPLDSSTSRFDFILNLVQRDGGLDAHFEYNLELFDRGTMARMAGHYARLLQAMADRDPAPLAALPLLTEDERRQLLQVWPGDGCHHAVTTCLHQRFEARVVAHPDAVAVRFEGASLTYGQLNHRANHLAHHLRGLGVGPEVVVAVCSQRSPHFLLAMLAILKAGGAYVPMDPMYPADRMAFITEDSGARLLLTQERLMDEVADPAANFPPSDLERVDLDPWFQIEAPCTNPVNRTSPDQLAYMIYTSGSTGRPKGAIVPHQQAIRLFEATRADCHFGEHDTFTLFHSHAFDFSVWEIWGAFLHGGRLVVVPRHISQEPEAFYRLLVSEDVNVLSQTPTAFTHVIQQDELHGAPLSLRIIMLGGESVDPNTLAPWFARHGENEIRLYNVYGITETTVLSTFYRLSARDLTSGRGSIIGRPMDDLRIYICDRRLRPVPIGVPGELLTGGPALTRGYLNRPGLTASRFVPDPFGDEPGARLYRSGDLVRYHDNADIEFLGRIDFQVQLRGFRIEPGEIENRLSAHDRVRTAVVLPRDDLGGPLALVAYVVPEGDAVPGVTTLRHYISQVMPDYMIPAWFVFLDVLPMTTNGKVDRRRLPLPEMARQDEEQAFVAPESAEELLLAEIWSDVLGLARVGLDDNFFALGGDSILSTKILARVRDRGYQLTLQDLFREPTIRRLAARITREEDIRGALGPFDLLPGGRPADLAEAAAAWPLTSNQIAAIFEHLRDPGSGIGRDASCLHLRYRYDEVALLSAWRQCVAEHEILRADMVFDPHKAPIMRIRSSAPSAVVFEDLRHLPNAAQEAHIDAWLSAMVREPIEWDQAPLVQCHVHQRADDRFQLSFLLPAALMDGWSQAAMRTDLLSRYSAILAGENPPQKSAPTSYRHYVRRVQASLEDPDALAFWLDQLDGATPSRLPACWLKQADDEGGDRESRYFLPKQLSDELHQQAATLGKPLKTLLLAAHYRALTLIHGTADVITGLACGCREEGEAGTMGLYLNTLPLRLRLKPGSWRLLIEEVHQREVAILPHQTFPGERLMTIVGRGPLFQVGFSYTHFHIYKQADLRGLELISRRGVQLSHLPLAVGFNEDVFTGQLRLDLMYGPRFDAACLVEVRELYLSVLEHLARDPAAEYLPTSQTNYGPPEGLEAPPVEVPYREPGSEAERLVAGCWARVLNRRPIGVETPFSALGGSRVKAVRLWHALRSACDIAPPLDLVYPHGTPAQMTHWLQQRGAEVGQLLELSAAPLSASQQRLWFLYQLEGPSSAYNVAFGQVLEGPLMVSALETAVDEVFGRHDILRVNIRERDGRPVQQITHDRFPGIRVIEVATPAHARQLANRELTHRFELERECLVRVLLLRLDPQKHYLLLNLHHVLADGWSVDIFMRETARYYEALVRGQVARMPQLPQQFLDVARAEAQHLSGDRLQRLSDYWLDTLGDAPTVLELPTDRPRPATISGKGAAHIFRVEAELTHALEVLSRQAGTTLFVTLLSAWKILLARYSGADDLLTGTPVANRNQSAHQALIGFFANTLVIRAQLDDNPSVTMLLERIRGQVLGAFEHSDMPFEKLAERLNPDRALNHNPVFQVMFAFQNAGGTRATPFHGLRVDTVEDMELADSAFDLALSMMASGDGLTGILEYATDLFDEATVTRMMSHYRQLLQQMCAAPEATVFQLPMMTVSERESLVHDWASEPCDDPRGEIFGDLFAAAVARYGEREALVFDEGASSHSLNFKELDRLSNGLAVWLQQRGIAPETIVGLHLHRGLAPIVAMLGVQKAGAAWLPLDPNLPEERLMEMIGDARPASILSNQSVSFGSVPAVAVDRLGMPTGVQPCSTPPAVMLSPDHLAYMIYTSGSTGKPKGVMLHHRGLCQFTRQESRRIGIGEGDRCLQFASLSFDACVAEIYNPLLVGTTVVTAPRDLLLGDSAMVALMLRQRITYAVVPPTVLAYLDTSELPHLKYLGSAGEALSPELVRRHRAPGRQIRNIYGPTEATVGVSTSKPLDGSGRPDIGRPFGHTRFYLLDRFMAPVPVGVPGKLFIGGDCLARGYHDRPAHTASRFVPDPFGTEPGRRLYDSGDLARYLTDRRVDHLGRADHQVKLRGFRIELGEIENELLRNERVAAAAVLVVDKQLAAVLVANGTAEGLADSCASQLAQRLPAYMVPALFHCLDSLPLSSSGKVDRKALTRLLSEHQREAVVLPPRNAVESRLLAIWEDLLGKSAIGIHDEFFALGGHSLLAVRLLNQVADHFGVKLPLASLFQGGTIAQLAARIGGTTSDAGLLVPLRADGEGSPLILIHPGGGEIFAYRPLSELLPGPIYAIRAPGLDDGEPLLSIEAMARRYWDELEDAGLKGPFHLAGWSLGGAVAYEMARQAKGQQVAHLSLIDSYAPSLLPALGDDAELLREFCLDLARLLDLDLASLPVLNFSNPAEQVMTALMETGLLPAGLDEPRLSRAFAVFRANAHALASFRPGKYKGPLTLIRAVDASVADPPRGLGWGELAEVTELTIQGDHYSIMEPPNLEQLAQKLHRTSPLT